MGSELVDSWEGSDEEARSEIFAKQLDAQIKAARVAGLREAAEIADGVYSVTPSAYAAALVATKLRAKADAIEKGTE
jgi:hypothetical protein